MYKVTQGDTDFTQQERDEAIERARSMSTERGSPVVVEGDGEELIYRDGALMQYRYETHRRR